MAQVALTCPSDTELMLLCTAAAQRGSAFCRVLGSAEQQSWLDSGLELAWSAAAGEEVADECAELLDALDALDVLDAGDDEGEAYEGHGGYDDDPTARPGFYADQAVGLVGEALAMSIRPSAERVETVLKTLRTLLSMVDFKLGGEKPVIVRGGEPRPAPGPLVQREEDAEREVLAAPAVAEAQESAQAFVAEVTPSVEEFAEASHWD